MTSYEKIRELQVITWYYPYNDPVVTTYNEYGWYKFFFYKGFKFILN